MALWVNERCRPRLPALAYFTPTVLPMIAVANIWLFFYTPSYGLLEQWAAPSACRRATGWATPTALAAVTVVAVWKEAGFFMIFYLAALQGMNPSLREAAAIEGASRWFFFRRVLWPLLMPTTLFVMRQRGHQRLPHGRPRVRDDRGGPDNATALLLYHLYEVGFKFWDPATRGHHRGAAGGAGHGGAAAVLRARPQDPLPVSTRTLVYQDPPGWTRWRVAAGAAVVRCRWPTRSGPPSTPASTPPASRSPRR
jgi:hypothetical protein